ncbi:MAG: OmpA family protein [Bacteroidales bacterium]|nr:OmpA family protein [Bacteroidales bacterium]
MKINKISFIAMLSFVFFSMLLFSACSGKGKLKKADQAFNEYKYDKALKIYKKVQRKLKDKDKKNYVLWKMAECNRFKSDYKNLPSTYKTLIDCQYDTIHPEIYLYYGNYFLQANRLDKAQSMFQTFIDKDTTQDVRGPAALQKVALAQEYEINPGKYDVIKVKSLSSTFDDFCPTYSNQACNELIFTSNRGEATGKLKDEWTGNKFSDLFITRKDLKGRWGTPVLLEEDKVINSETNEGSPMMNQRFTTLYFTRCEKSDESQVGCGIYTTKRQGTLWNEPARLALSEDSMAVIGHPAVSTDETFLIFASDLSGGKGGKDLWIARGKSGSYDDIQNLGSVINTPGDEMFPYLHGDTVLYFASDFHPGMGGLDIFRSNISVDEAGNTVFSEPVNLRFPINTIADDFGICFHPDGSNEGFFSSARKGSQGVDLYYFVLEPVIFTISGVMMDEKTMLYEAGVTVTLTGSDGSAIQTVTGENGSYTFNKTQVHQNVDYELLIEKEGFFSKIEKISTVGLENSKNFKVNVDMISVPKDPIVLPEILFDLAKWDLKPQFQDSLRGLIGILEANPSLVVELAAHTDSRGSEESNDELSQKRAQSVVDYLIDRGIESPRLVAKGYGERVPRTIQQPVTRDGFTFETGTVLTEDFINGLESRVHREAAFQLNRRIEFSIISTRYTSAVQDEKPKVVIATQDNSVIYVPEGKKELPKMEALINKMSEFVVLDESARNAVISLDGALQLLRDGYISKDDFLGDPEKVIVGGSIVKGAKFNIDEIKIGTRVAYDFQVVVDHNWTEPLTITKEMMQRFGNYEIDIAAKRIVFVEENQ